MLSWILLTEEQKQLHENLELVEDKIEEMNCEKNIKHMQLQKFKEAIESKAQQNADIMENILKIEQNLLTIQQRLLQPESKETDIDASVTDIVR